MSDVPGGPVGVGTGAQAYVTPSLSRAKRRFRVVPWDGASWLTNTYHGRLFVGSDIVVVDVCFARASIFTKLNGFGNWPSREQLCGFVMRKDWPKPSQLVHWVRYDTRWGACYRLYINDPMGGVEVKDEL